MLYKTQKSEVERLQAILADKNQQIEDLISPNALEENLATLQQQFMDIKELITDQEINQDHHGRLFSQFTKILDINLENKNKKKTIYIQSASQTDPVKIKEPSNMRVNKSREKGADGVEEAPSMSLESNSNDVETGN